MMAFLWQTGARGALLGLLACALAGAACELLTIVSVVPLMAGAAGMPNLPALERLAGAPPPLLVCGLLSLVSQLGAQLLNALSVWIAMRVATQQQTALSRRLLTGYLTRSYQWHLDHHSLNLHVMLGRARTLSDGYYRPLLTLLGQGTAALAITSALLLLDLRLTALTLAALLTVFPLVYQACRRRLYALSQEELALTQRMGVGLSDCLGMLKNIQLGGSQPHYVQGYASQVERLGELQRRRLVVSELPRMLVHLLAQSTMVALVLILQSRGDRLVIASVSLFAIAFYRLLPCLQACLAAALTLRSSQPYLQLLAADLRQLGAEPAPAEPLAFTRELVARDLRYTYPGQTRPALAIDRLTIRKGSKVGIVGPTGSGKTTLLNVLVGLLPGAGQLEVDGQAVAPDRLASWQRLLGYVPQDVFLADTGLDANIALGVRQPDPARLQDCLRRAALEDLVANLPEGVRTAPGENGIRLSGGQRQRVGIARALYHGAQLLVLDESTSALDLATEAEVMRSVRDLGETVLVVSHRPSSVQDCDEIYLLREGTIEARGTYAELFG